MVATMRNLVNEVLLRLTTTLFLRFMADLKNEWSSSELEVGNPKFFRFKWFWV